MRWISYEATNKADANHTRIQNIRAKLGQKPVSLILYREMSFVKLARKISLYTTK